MNKELEQFFGAKVEAQRSYFRSGATLPYRFRREQLKKLLAALDDWQESLCQAVWKDLHKSPQEAVITELGIVRAEIRHHLKHLRKWMRPRKVATPLKMFPSRSRQLSEPLGTVLIVAPWNYPIQLLLNPLVGAISAGCTAILKTSPAAPHTADVLERMVGNIFEEQYVAAYGGHRDVNGALLAQQYDLIFFTGSPSLGQTVMEAAAKNLTPVVLELGGKSPTIVTPEADIKMAARRIAWGKTLNAGQTCIAPDYLLLHRSLKEPFVEAFAKALEKLHGKDIRISAHYGRMVNDKAFERVAAYIEQGKVLYGGTTVAEERYIEPTLLEVADTAEVAVMQEEIFGPVLPVVYYDDIAEAEEFIISRQKPLALYYFGAKRGAKSLLARCQSGGACVGDTIMHIANENMPFGGVGHSGMGRYHGVESFRAFSHLRSVVYTPGWVDVPLRYMPYKGWWLTRRLLR